MVVNEKKKKECKIPEITKLFVHIEKTKYRNDGFKLIFDQFQTVFLPFSENLC